MKTESLKLYYAAGPGDVVGTFRHWLKNQDDPAQFAQTYSAQFFDVARAARAEALVVSSCDRARSESVDGITVVNCPLSNTGRRGRIDFLKRQFETARNFWRDILRFRPDAAVIAEGTTWWTLVAPLRLFGIRLIPSIHCVLWPPQAPRSWKRRLFDRIEMLALRFLSSGCLSASSIIDRQLPPGMNPRRFLPSYRRDRFASIVPIDPGTETCRLLYAGRIEDDKGVFDLLEAFRIARSQTERPLHLDFCGTGSALTGLAKRVRELRLDRAVSLKGHCTFESFQRHLGNCHAVVVPTTSRFVEGFNQVVVEGFLAGRPVIATRVCPAAHDLGQAVVMVPPDSPESLAKAIENLFAAPMATPQVSVGGGLDRESFFDDSRSWRTQFWHSLDALFTGRKNPVTRIQTVPHA
jgi:glycosyltransferase involved in cell wall biosynthesis